MSNFDASSYASFWRKCNREERNRIRERSKESRGEAEKFEIDLAIFGGNWFRACEITKESAFKIDVVEYENLPSHIKARIDAKGVILKKT